MLCCMGFKDRVRAAREHAQYDAHLGDVRVLNGELCWWPKGQKGERRPIGGATAVFESGSARERTTVTRVAAGAIIAGPVGAIVGGLLRKQEGRVYVTITLPDGSVVVADAPVKDEAAARAFAQKVNAAGAHYPVEP
ncbi:hypothetical protein [Cellulomonas uda]|nr:hypothetical protein [Cellulomonas uda]NII67831.1 hypothetical protein [Cellulomonas uda]